MDTEKIFDSSVMAKVDIILGFSILFSMLLNASGLLSHAYVMYYNLLIFAQVALLLLYHAVGWMVKSELPEERSFS